MNQKKYSQPVAWINHVIDGKKHLVVWMIILQSVLSLTGVLTAWFFKHLVDSATKTDWERFLRYAVGLVLLSVIMLALAALRRRLNEHSRCDIENTLKKRLLRSILNRDYAAITATHSAEWMNRMTNDTSVVTDGIVGILPGLFGMVVQLIGALIMVLMIVPRFAAILLPCGVLLLIVTYAFRKKLKVLHKNIQEADGRFRIFTGERLESLMIVKAFAKEKTTIAGAEEKMNAHKAARMRRNTFSNLCNIGFGILMRGSYIACAIWGGYGILTKTLSYGSFIALIQLIGQIQNPFANISGFLPRFYAMTASAERLMEAEQYPPDLPDDLEADTPADFSAIGLKHASFHYRPTDPNDDTPMPPVLIDRDITIEKGQFVAFTGHSGSGKSTVLKILMCMYPLDAGEAYLADATMTRPLTALDRRLFAYVPQGNQLMAGTVKEIVSFNEGTENEPVDPERIRNALTVACAEGFVADLDKGIDTLLGEKGTGLSEGQMQRLAIARAIYADRPILLLDEVTSSLDADTELQLLKNIRSMTDKTVIIVTHRNAALDFCDTQVSF